MTIFDEATAVRRRADGVYDAHPDQRFALVALGGATPPAVRPAPGCRQVPARERWLVRRGGRGLGLGREPGRAEPPDRRVGRGQVRSIGPVPATG